ncbi:MAG TPA: hypothetical protein VFX06_09265, partial [Stellaceae bacterium]|nr:hypothetical protein [Stellaceae bacterium]
GQAAEPGGGPHPAAAAARMGPGPGPDKISFEDYRAWRLHWNERRLGQLTRELAAPGLSAGRKTHLTEVKAYYDWLTGLSDAERDRRFHERFDRIDTDRDGMIDPAERTAWREKRHALFSHARGARPTARAGGI